MKIVLLFSLIVLTSIRLNGNIDTLKSDKLNFEADFRFRVEHDWNSFDHNGELRSDRSRLRYRFRFGANYRLDSMSSFGGRLRSGNINDQQGPHVTLGGNNGEFGLVSLGFEKLFYKYKNKNLEAWVGKNTLPLFKSNELFWNDNVYPEGIAFKYVLFDNTDKFISKVDFNSGHFIINSNNQSFNNDSYLQVAQLKFEFWDKMIDLFPGFYFFNDVGNIPDGKEYFSLDYSIFHFGINSRLFKNYNIELGFEYYRNFENYLNIQEVEKALKDQRNGFVLSFKYGTLTKKDSWCFHVYYANLQKYSIVDYFAQNDWARWDYASHGASGARLSNFKGFELRIGYAIKNNINLVLRSYVVEELVSISGFKENGNRIRLDLNVGF